ncbi:hypothetical protein IQ273_31345 [Nodosilinea sp. LEGE 07298]|uniref:hypothetical protein n=1 Tax=Nodosilinea sp. LEGE 07298 TaxID=2777970 RepID=UPI00187E794B|nr:hypothetical protein [Nodosilinea sp. LEGE 07298]MBE9113868.1 hypothetical protein [Nodosilinea sp. LEGE 07298]
MRLNRTVFAGLAGLCLLLVSLIAALGFNLARASDPIPEAVYDCLPPQTQATKLWGLVETASGSYLLIGAGEGETYQEVLIYLDAQAACRSLLPEDDPVLSHYIPLNLARELALQRYTQVLQEQGGRDAYQQQLTEYLTAAPEGTRSQFPEEYLWALEQLGIELPPNSYEVLR